MSCLTYIIQLLQVDSCQLFQFLLRKMKISHNKPGATAAGWHTYWKLSPGLPCPNSKCFPHSSIYLFSFTREYCRDWRRVLTSYQLTLYIKLHPLIWHQWLTMERLEHQRWKVNSRMLDSFSLLSLSHHLSSPCFYWGTKFRFLFLVS